MGILFALLLTLPSFAENKTETLTAVVSHSCAPWDGAARLVQVEKLGLRVNLYKKDIAAFQEGGTIYISRNAQGTASTAQIEDPKSILKWKGVDLEIQWIPKANSGHVIVNGISYPLQFEEKKSDKPQFCG